MPAPALREGVKTVAPRPNRFPATLLGAGVATLACLPPTALGWAAAVQERPGAGPAARPPAGSFVLAKNGPTASSRRRA